MSNPSITIYHVSPVHTIHKGPKANCPSCMRAAAKKKRADARKSATKDKKRIGRKRSNPPRKCAECKTDIHRQNKSGYCIRCLNAKKREGMSKPKEPRRRCSTCDKPISHVSKSGLCRKCWASSPVAKKARSTSQAWINSAVFNRNARPESNKENGS